MGFGHFPVEGQSTTLCKVVVSYPNKPATESTDAASTDPVLPLVGIPWMQTITTLVHGVQGDHEIDGHGRQI